MGTGDVVVDISVDDLCVVDFCVVSGLVEVMIEEVVPGVLVLDDVTE